jgi:D-xylose transport system substrate-binding protein
VSRSLSRLASTGAVLALALGGLAACSSPNDSNDGGGGGDKAGKTIALLLPESKTTRYETFDKPLFEAKVKDICSDCKVDYYNADQDSAKQAQQVDTAIGKGAKVLVLDPVDGKAAASMVTSAHSSDVKVIAYDRFIEGADYYMSFDNETVGKMQAQALVDALGNKGNILMLNGSPTDPNAGQFKKGAHSVIDASGVKILPGGEYDNPDWSGDNAQKFVASKLGTYKPTEIQGIYAANDDQAGGAVAALTGAGVKDADLPPITGQDASLAGLQRIVAGQQLMTIYKPIPVEADQAAETAVALLKGDDVGDTTDFQGVKSFIFTPIVVTKDNIKDTVIKDKFYTAQDICTGSYASACQAAGIS